MALMNSSGVFIWGKRALGRGTIQFDSAGGFSLMPVISAPDDLFNLVSDFSAIEYKGTGGTEYRVSVPNPVDEEIAEGLRFSFDPAVFENLTNTEDQIVGVVLYQTSNNRCISYHKFATPFQPTAGSSLTVTLGASGAVEVV